MTDVTQILNQIEQGDPHAAEQLLPLIYAELRTLATTKLAHEKPGQTLQATALVHEAYLKLDGDHTFSDRHHFFRVAAEAMRQILVDRGRRRRRVRHGGDLQRVGLSEVASVAGTPPDDVVALDEALEKFAAIDAPKAELVKLRYFAGLSEQEAAAALGISRATASRHWTYARAWLIREMEEAS